MFGFDFETQTFLIDATSSFASFALNWFLQSTVLILVGLTVGVLLKSRGSAAQSLVYRTTLVAVLVCPLATFALFAAGFSGWSVELPASWAVETQIADAELPEMEALETTLIESADAAPELPTNDWPPLEATDFGNTDAIAGSEAESGLDVIADDQSQTPVDQQPTVAESDSSVASAPAAALSGTSVSISRIGMAVLICVAIWFVVAFVLLSKLATAWIKLWRLKRDAVRAESELKNVCQRLAKQMNVVAPKVLRSPFLPSPCLAGLRKPSILLPEEDCRLSIQDVLVHELAHLRRHDCHWNLLRRLATSVFFFQPMLWLLSRRLEVSAEEVCDDFVVQYGGDRAEYANRLVDIAELSTAPVAAAGVGVVSIRSMLAQRVTRILDTSRTLSTRTSNLILAVVLTGGLLGTTLTGMLGLGSATSEPDIIVLVDEESGDYNFSGKVVDPNGQPAVGAELSFVGGLAISSMEPLAITNESGEFEFALTEEEMESRGHQDLQHLKLAATKAGFGFAMLPALLFEKELGKASELRKQLEEATGWERDRVARLIDLFGKPLKLVDDDQVISGKIVDIEGQVVEGAKLTVVEVFATDQGDLSQWHEAASEPTAYFYSAMEKTKNDVYGPQIARLVRPVSTDREGKFSVRGVGKNRIVRFLVEGDTIASAKVYARTEPGKPVQLLQERSSPGAGSDTFHSNEFTYIAGPTVAITGTVRDAETKEPLAGIAIESRARHGERTSGWSQDFVQTVTDKDGKYRLVGMPIGSDNRIAAIAPEAGDIAYLSQRYKTPTSADDGETVVDMELPRGVWVQGTITDKETGSGLRGVVEYFATKENPNYSLAVKGVDQRDRMRTDKEGKYKIAVFPGQGYITFLSSDDYQRTKYITKADGTHDKVSESMMIQTAPYILLPVNSHFVVEINPPVGEDILDLNFSLDNSTNLQGHAVDMEGERVNEIFSTGQLLESWRSWTRTNDGKLELFGYDGAVGRDVFVVSQDSKLAGVAKLSGKQDAEFVVKLQPAGTVTGRLLDEDGVPIANCQLSPFNPRSGDPMVVTKRIFPPLPANVAHSRAAHYETDAEGRFEIRGLVPGIEYHIEGRKGTSRRKPPELEGPLESAFQVEPGESKDLGDVRFGDKDQIRAELEKRTTSSKPEAINQPEASKDDLISGVVMSTDRKPVAGAEIWSIASRGREYDPIPPKLIATSDEKGKYSFRKPKLDLPEDAPARWGYKSKLIVKAAGHGFVTESPGSLLQQMERSNSPQGWLAQTLAGVSGAVIGLPAAGNPIKGRVLDVDGQPVANARIRIQWFTGYGSMGFRGLPPSTKQTGKFVDNTPEQWEGAIDSLVQIIEPTQAIEVFPTATTDADGRFELKDIGANRLFTLVVQGEEIETKIVYAYNQPGEKATAKSVFNGQGTDKYTVHPQEFTHVAGPSNLVSGTVVDYDTDQPIPGALVMATLVHGSNSLMGDARGLFTVKTNEKGKFNMNGLPVGRGNRLVCFCKNTKAPYPLLGFDADTTSGRFQDRIRMKQGVWAEGKVFDSQTKRPWTGFVNYYYFRNPKLEATHRGVRSAKLQFAYWTNNDGGFRVPVWPTRGLLCYFHNPKNHEEAMERPINKYPRGQLAGKIEGYDKKRRTLETFPTIALPSRYWMTKEINPDGSQDSIVADLPLVASRSHMAKVTWPEETGITNYRLYNSNGHEFWNQVSSSEVEVKGLKQGEQREIYAFHRGKNLIGKATVDASMPEGKVVEIKEFQKSGFIVGKLVDQDGEPIVNGILDREETSWAFHPGKMSNPGRIPTDEKGNFRLTGLVPGKSYGASVSAPRKYMNQMMNMGIGDAFSGVVIGPGETKDLGTIRIGDQDEDVTDDTKKSADSKPASEVTETKPEGSGEISKIIRTVILLPDGNGAAETHVALTGYSGEAKKNVVFGSGITNSDGECILTLKEKLGPDDFDRSLIARKDGLAVGWKKVNDSVLASDEPITVRLSEMGVIKGRIVDVDGQPAAGEKLQVRSISDPQAGPESDEAYMRIWINKIDGLTQAWIQSVTTDKDGRFELTGVPEKFGVHLELFDSKKFAPQGISLNTGRSEQREARDGTYRPLVKNVQPGEEAVITIASAKIITGQITYEDTNEPVANTKISIWASQQEYGSRVTVTGKTDADGKYRMIPKPGIRFGVSAYPPSGVAYMGREAEKLVWENGDETRNVDIKLPRVTLVKGRVIEKGTGMPVGNATITYETSDRNAPKNAITGWQAQQKTDDDGKFTYAVSPGIGTLVVRKKGSHYVLQTMDSRKMKSTKPGGSRFYANAFHTMEIEKGTDNIEAKIEVLPGKTVRGEIVDEEGNSIEEAVIVTRLKSWDLSGGWRGDSRPTVGGKFELKGLAPGEKYKVHFLEARRRLGTTIEINATDDNVKVVLQPCGSAKAKFVVEDDDNREMLKEIGAHSLNFVLNSGVPKYDFGSMKGGALAADEDSNSVIDRVNYGGFGFDQGGPKFDNDLSITYPALIPGATYRIQTSFDQSWGYKEFIAKPGETLDLGEITPTFED